VVIGRSRSDVCLFTPVRSAFSSSNRHLRRDLMWDRAAGNITREIGAKITQIRPAGSIQIRVGCMLGMFFAQSFPPA